MAPLGPKEKKTPINLGGQFATLEVNVHYYRTCTYSTRHSTQVDSQ